MDNASESSAIDQESHASVSCSAEIDGYGIKGFLSMREEGLTYHRMKRYFNRCIGVVFLQYVSQNDDSSSSEMHESASFTAEIDDIQPWDGKGLLRTYHHGFRLSFRHGKIFNFDAADLEERNMWMNYIQKALKSTVTCVSLWNRFDSLTENRIMTLPSPSALSFSSEGDLKPEWEPPKFQNRSSCTHPKCSVRFEGKTTTKRQHHCRNCGSTVCSYHSQRFISLLHYRKARAVRVCTRCYRVQRFILNLSLLLQGVIKHHRVSEHHANVIEVDGVSPGPISETSHEEMARIRVQIQEEGFGISDAIQLLHLHRHGSDSVYEIVIKVLLQLSEKNIEDFEFFVPQLFHMWITMPGHQSNIKLVLLMNVITSAACRHIRLATCLYWLARAAVDDSCGWGYDQSEYLIPDYLFRKFCACKLLLINLEMQVMKNWHFESDNDLPASPLQTLMIQSLFKRLQILLKPISAQNTESKLGMTSMGVVFDAMRLVTLPTSFYQASHCIYKYHLPLPIEDNPGSCLEPEAGSAAEIRERVLKNQLQFMKELCDLTERLRHLPVSKRKFQLPAELEGLDVAHDVFYPLGSCTDEIHRFVSVIQREGAVFTTKARAPTLIFFQVEKVDEDEKWKIPWLKQLTEPETNADRFDLTESKSSKRRLSAIHALERAASSDLAHTLSLQLMKSNEDDLQIPMEDAKAASFVENEARPRSGSLIHSTTHTIEQCIEGYVDDTNALLRSNENDIRLSSFCSDMDAHAQRSDLDSSYGGTEDRTKMLSKFELYTETQLASIAFNLAQDISHGRNSDDHNLENLRLTGQEVLSWMIQSEIVRDKHNAIWLGEELVRSGALERDGEPSSPLSSVRIFEPSELALYRLGKLAAQTTPRVRVRKRNSTHSRIERLSGKAITNLDGDGNLRLRGQIRTKIADFEHYYRDSLHEAERIAHEEECAKSCKTSAARNVASALSSAAKKVVLDSDLAASRSEPADEHSSLEDRKSNFSTSMTHSFLDSFSIDATMQAINTIEHSIEQSAHLQANHEEHGLVIGQVQVLRDQLDLIYSYVSEKRLKYHMAVESAFGESFEEKKERLRNQLSAPERWDLAALIVKSNDDLRQEKFCLQIIRQLQDIFDDAELPLRLLPYKIIATSASTGMIEYIKNATSLDSLKKQAGYTNLAQHFVKTYGNADTPKYRNAMANFVRSLAAYSLVCYLLQIKDRHNGNIMLDKDGFLVHIDYGFILGIAPGGKFSLETAPFKLPQEMVDAMGGAKSEYFKAYVILMIQGFLALRQHANTILMMIAIMAHESPFPCFLSQHPRDVLARTERLFKLDLNQEQVIKFVLQLVRKSQNSYRTWQYDVFQKITNGIHP